MLFVGFVGDIEVEAAGDEVAEGAGVVGAVVLCRQRLEVGQVHLPLLVLKHTQNWG